MKMAFLVICPGSFQYNEEKGGGRDMDCARERERERGGEAAEKVERKKKNQERERWGERNKTSEHRESQRRAFIEFRKGHAAPFRAHYHS